MSEHGNQERAKASVLTFASILRHSMVVLVPFCGTVAAFTLWALGLEPGLIEFSLFIVFYVLNILGMELALHRYFTHNAFKTKPFVRGVLSVMGSLAYMGPIIWWVALHRIHHHNSDQPGDPHSPRPLGSGLKGRIKGIIHGHVGWLFDSQSARPENWRRYARDLYQDPKILKMHMSYDFWLLFGLLLPAMIGGVLRGSWEGALLGFLWGGTARVFFATNAIWAVNSIGHAVAGQRPFDQGSDESSRNHFWLALLTLGAGWHNNHHAYPSCASTSFKWWQIDITGLIITALNKMGLVWDVRHPNPALRTTTKSRASQPNRTASQPNSTAP